ncbi:MAG: helix-turn-helix transcriptional regulator [Solirubrobacterales bacterium]|nr:helix-turn-helix transcriptional regulator [Solirubrobacterales bacterium]
MSPSALPDTGRRTYRSATRERRARETRERILAAACSMFLRSGYAATTMRAVAREARVSVPTVELDFGTKPQLLRAAISFAIRGDAKPVPMLERGWALSAERARTTADFLAIVRQVLVDAAARSAGLVLAAFEAADVDQSMRPLAEQLRTQRAETAAWIVDGVRQRSSLRAGISRKEAIDTVWLLMDPHGFRALTRDRGWSPEQFGQWFVDGVSRLLLDQTRASGGTDGPRSSPAPRLSQSITHTEGDHEPVTAAAG